MKSFHRILLCCFVAWFCSAVVECLVKSNPGVILDDTGDENTIKISDEVCERDFPKCTTTGGYCNVKAEEASEKSAAQCECPDKSVYEASKGCTVSYKVCKTYFPKCMDTGGKCNVEVGNENEQSVVHCECPETKGYKEGVGCKACDCGINSTGCSFVGDFKTCTCLPKTGQYEGKCVDCNCGKNSIGCKFSKYGQRICKCKEKFSPREQKCVVSDEVCESDFPKCTTTGGYCNVEDEGEIKKSAGQCFCPDKSVYEVSGGCTVSDEVCKIEAPKCVDTGGKCKNPVESYQRIQCECPKMKGYDEDVGCKECDCGISASGCKFLYGFKTCFCLPNSVLKGGKCVDCNCGKNSTGCSFTYGGNKICKCNEKFSQNEDICEECDCGEKSAGCLFQMGEKMCHCYSGYDQIYGVCTEETETESGLSASAIIGIIVSVLVGILILVAVVFYVFKYSKNSSSNRNVPDHRISSENTLNNTISNNPNF